METRAGLLDAGGDPSSNLGIGTKSGGSEFKSPDGHHAVNGISYKNVKINEISLMAFFIERS